MNRQADQESQPLPTTGAIDQSCRWPVLALFGGALVWLSVGTALLLVSGIKLHSPEFLSGGAWTTYGRTQPAAIHLLLYGFACQAAFGIGTWLLARLGGVALGKPFVPLVGIKLWNIAVALGLYGILAGDRTGHYFLEMPPYASALLLAGLFPLAVWMLLAFGAHRGQHLYPSQWFILAGILWLTWSFCVAEYLLVCAPRRGVMQPIVNTWFGNCFLNLWLAPIGLAAAFYFIPKRLNRALHSEALAKAAFWTLAIFGAGCGFHHGMPVPRWLPAVSSVCEVMMLIAILAIAVNFHKTFAANYRALGKDVPAMLIAAGVLSWLFAGLLQLTISRPGIREATQFSWLAQGRFYLVLLGFAMPVLLGAMQAVIPRITASEWPCKILPRLVAWNWLGGMVLLIGGLLIAGTIQGGIIQQAQTPFIESYRQVRPWLVLSSAGMFFLVMSAGAYAGQLGLMAYRWGRARRGWDWLAQGCEGAEARP